MMVSYQKGDRLIQPLVAGVSPPQSCAPDLQEKLGEPVPSKTVLVCTCVSCSKTVFDVMCRGWQDLYMLCIDEVTAGWVGRVCMIWKSFLTYHSWLSRSGIQTYTRLVFIWGGYSNEYKCNSEVVPLPCHFLFPYCKQSGTGMAWAIASIAYTCFKMDHWFFIHREMYPTILWRGMDFHQTVRWWHSLGTTQVISVLTQLSNIHLFVISSPPSPPLCPPLSLP